MAKFLPTHGEWLPLTPDDPALAGWSMNDILLNTRGAADLVGATKMDRPEWIDTFPEALTAIGTLTNNTRRGTGTNPGTDGWTPAVLGRGHHQGRRRRDWQLRREHILTARRG